MSASSVAWKTLGCGGKLMRAASWYISGRNLCDDIWPMLSRIAMLTSSRLVLSNQSDVRRKTRRSYLLPCFKHLM